MTKVTFPTGNKYDVVSAENVKVGGFRRLMKIEKLSTRENLSPEENRELFELIVEALYYLVPGVTDADIDECSMSQLHEILAKANQGVVSEADGEQGETDEGLKASSKTPKGTRSRKTSK